MRSNWRRSFPDILYDINLSMIYTFAYLDSTSDRKNWKISRRYLETKRNSGDLMTIGPTTVKGEWLLICLKKSLGIK